MVRAPQMDEKGRVQLIKRRLASKKKGTEIIFEPSFRSSPDSFSSGRLFKFGKFKTLEGAQRALERGTIFQRSGKVMIDIFEVKKKIKRKSKSKSVKNTLSKKKKSKLVSRNKFV